MGKYYKVLIFDFDGVLLDSKKVKSRLFYQATFPYGESKELLRL